MLKFACKDVSLQFRRVVHLYARLQIIALMTCIPRVFKTSYLIKFELVKSSKHIDHKAGSLEVNKKVAIGGVSTELKMTP